MSPIPNWIGQVALGFKDRAERRPLPGLIAFHANGRKSELDRIRNISATGMFLETRARWPKNALISLWIQKAESADASTDQGVALQATVVRRDANRVGLSFVLPEGLSLNLWESPLKTTADAAGPDDVLREFRMAAAISFLGKLCPEGRKTICRLLRIELSNYRVASAVDIALRAESLLSLKPRTSRMRIDPRLAIRILEEGSWAVDEWRRKLWAGLLATCWAAESKTALNLTLVDAMSQLAVVHAKMLIHACEHSTKVISEDGVVSALPLTYSTDEMITITGTHDLHRIDCDLEHLAGLGLFIKREKSRFFVALDDTSLTPSTLGLELYARSSGHRGALADFYSVATTDFWTDGPVN
ncbi:MAG TPA: PilZ domain-containing protein [Terracidiphilus sp.]|nr:PilZ domain-containing protein [Terracidiphilus sp.]